MISAHSGHSLADSKLAGRLRVMMLSVIAWVCSMDAFTCLGGIPWGAWDQNQTNHSEGGFLGEGIIGSYSHPIFGQTNPTVVEHRQIHTHYIPWWISSGRLVLYSTLPRFSSLKAQVWINSNIQPKQQINKWFTITPYVSTNHHNYSTSQTKSRTTSIPHDISWHRTVASFI